MDLTLAEVAKELTSIRDIMRSSLEANRKALKIEPHNAQALFAIGYYERKVTALDTAVAAVKEAL